ncbi:hypothetical protein, unlikely [Trypanosoma brucei gambiense DAL972]|uniref:Uncharacterized protein n=1 Tax=Trypanosoma brucei gambiense (strain MHOM/CI/86/DAL972) TaxID=679716 RepID=D0A866_TRYB9|nr:hypothetical protein, unlikely [Trypanosoma brucei gambiense DAL972]CBH17867.1 hypothetical protein, unlikely [Trypanosoma brucei gambiense DAL972]|eukprot:XP_011780131.1 hypothetical protein, unlikely [Trypanosoma brucei gambiense DAL972]
MGGGCVSQRMHKTFIGLGRAPAWFMSHWSYGRFVCACNWRRKRAPKHLHPPFFFLNPHDCWLLSAVSLPFVGVTVTQLILIHCMSFLSSTHGTIGFCIVTRRLQLCKGLFIPSSNICQLYCSCASS